MVPVTSGKSFHINFGLQGKRVKTSKYVSKHFGLCRTFQSSQLPNDLAKAPKTHDTPRQLAINSSADPSQKGEVPKP